MGASWDTGRREETGGVVIPLALSLKGHHRLLTLTEVPALVTALSPSPAEVGVERHPLFPALGSGSGVTSSRKGFPYSTLLR